MGKLLILWFMKIIQIKKLMKNKGNILNKQANNF